MGDSISVTLSSGGYGTIVSTSLTAALIFLFGTVENLFFNNQCCESSDINPGSTCGHRHQPRGKLSLPLRLDIIVPFGEEGQMNERLQSWWDGKACHTTEAGGP